MVIRLFYCAGKYTCCMFIRLKQCIIVKKWKKKHLTKVQLCWISHQWLMAPIRRKQLQCNGLTLPLHKLIWVQLNAGRHRFEKGFTLFKTPLIHAGFSFSSQRHINSSKNHFKCCRFSHTCFFAPMCFKPLSIFTRLGLKDAFQGKTKKNWNRQSWSINNGKRGIHFLKRFGSTKT